jgi:hypothetical protein
MIDTKKQSGYKRAFQQIDTAILILFLLFIIATMKLYSMKKNYEQLHHSHNQLQRDVEKLKEHHKEIY